MNSCVPVISADCAEDNRLLMTFAVEKVVLALELLELGPLTTPISTVNDETPAQYRTINRCRKLFVVILIALSILYSLFVAEGPKVFKRSYIDH